MKSLKYIRDEVKGYRLPNRGYKPKGVVLHNDAGSVYATAESYHNGLVNAPESRLEAGIAHSYISGNTVWQALPESRIGWHTANAVGNKDYYGIEICQSIGASDKVFLANEQSAFQEAARMLKSGAYLLIVIQCDYMLNFHPQVVHTVLLSYTQAMTL